MLSMASKGKGPAGTLGEAAIAHFGKAPETLEHEERMFDLRTLDLRRFPFVGLGQRSAFRLACW